MKAKIYFTCFFLFYSLISIGQIKEYNYKRELKGVADTWHKIILPDELFGKVSPDFADLRIFGITEKKDTVEAPFLLQLSEEKATQKEIQFKLINQSGNQNGYYYTFEIQSSEPVNQVVLDFKQQNFDWKIIVEGSQNQQEWFTIAEDYRILSIKNQLTDYQFTKLTFPDAKYRFLRLLIKSKEKPDLLSAKIAEQKVVNGVYKTYQAKAVKTIQERKLKQTVIDVELPASVPVSYLKLAVHNTFDYYRPISIEYLVDSVKTQKGWIYNFNTITSGMLSSVEKNEFKFVNTISGKIRIIITNDDNEPLRIDSITVKGNVHTLLARFTQPAKYYLVYGNKGASKPYYDIEQFTDKIPANLTELSIGNEQKIINGLIPGSAPLFQNKVWLWVVMGLIIILLGWFSIRMISKG
ncbi:MAG: DUF3999 family protein [Daejeonella sp.]